jgi:MFS family permease
MKDKKLGDLTLGLWQLTVALYVLGSMCGAFGSSCICEKLGRRKANMVNQLPAILAGILSFGAKYAKTPELLMIGRFLAGLTAGAGCTYVPVYLVEIGGLKYQAVQVVYHIPTYLITYMQIQMVWGGSRGPARLIRDTP